MDKVDLNLDQALKAAHDAASESRQLLLSHFGKIRQIRIKSKAGLVTEADEKSEEKIVRRLKKFSSSIDVLAEENSYRKDYSDHQQDSNQWRWIVDPLDGTTNFVHGLPVFCISIALVRGTRPVLGVIDVPVLDQTFWAVQGKGAFMNHEPIQVSKTKSLEQSLLATGFMVSDQDRLDEQLRLFERMIKKSRGVRRLGAAAYDLCLVANGTFDGYWESFLKAWDVAAGQILVEEAGGRISQWDGLDHQVFSPNILAGNQAMFNKLLKNLQSALQP